MTFEQALSVHMQTRMQILQSLSRDAYEASQAQEEGIGWYIQQIGLEQEKAAREVYALVLLHETERFWLVDGGLVPSSCWPLARNLVQENKSNIHTIKGVREHMRSLGLECSLHHARTIVEAVTNNWCLEFFPSLMSERGEKRD